MAGPRIGPEEWVATGWRLPLDPGSGRGTAPRRSGSGHHRPVGRGRPAQAVPDGTPVRTVGTWAGPGRRESVTAGPDPVGPMAQAGRPPPMRPGGTRVPTVTPWVGQDVPDGTKIPTVAPRVGQAVPGGTRAPTVARAALT